MAADRVKITLDDPAGRVVGVRAICPGGKPTARVALRHGETTLVEISPRREGEEPCTLSFGTGDGLTLKTSTRVSDGMALHCTIDRHIVICG